MEPKILVTGATGQIGRSVVNTLINDGVHFRAMVHSPEKVGRVKKDSVEVIVGDFELIPTLERAMKGIEKVFLVSPTHEHQAQREKNVIDVAKHAGVKHIVKISALGAAEDSPLTLGKTHWEVEQHLKNSGVNYTVLRPHTFMQNTIGFSWTIQNYSAIYTSAGKGKIGMVDTRDIGYMAAKILQEEGHKGKIYTVTGPEAISFYEVADILSTHMDKKIRHINITKEESLERKIATGMKEWFAKDLVELEQIWASGKAEVVTKDLHRVTGQNPHSYDEFASDFLDYFQTEQETAIF